MLGASSGQSAASTMSATEPAYTPSEPTRRAKPSEAHTVAAVLAESFANDPVVSHLLRDTKQSDAWTKYFQIGVEVAFDQGEVWTDEHLTGACLFFAPNAWRISTWKELKSAWRIARATSLATTLQIRTVFHLLEDALPKEPHYYLLAIGVKAAQRKRGLGAALLRPMLERCNNEKRPAYLENTDPKNHRFYERHGFRRTSSLALPNATPSIDLMWRP